MLQGLGEQTLGFTDTQLFAIAVEGFDRHALGASQLPPEPRHGQAALVEGYLPERLDDLRVDDHGDCVVDVDDR